MNTLLKQNFFPTAGLPQLLNQAVNDITRNIMCNRALAAGITITAASLVCQEKILVKRPGGYISRGNIFLIQVAHSGERKSAVERKVFGPIIEFEETQRKAMQPIFLQYEVELAAWEEERKGILSAIRKCAKKGERYPELTEMLEELMDRKPFRLKTPRYFLNDATPEAILDSLKNQWSSSGLITDEGSIVFDSRAMNRLGVLNKLWDGDPIYVDRKTSESYILDDASLTVSIQVQPHTLKNYLDKKGHLARDNGFLARCFICFPESTQGWRLLDDSTADWSGLQAFQARLVQILSSASLNYPMTLEFSPEAEFIWKKFFNRVEVELREGGYLAGIRDSASKIAENLARLAGIFHMVEGRAGEIQADTIRQAEQVCIYYLEEFKKLFGADVVPQEYLDANLLETWVRDFCNRHHGVPIIKRNEIAHLGPNQLRQNKTRRDAALFVLGEKNMIRLVKEGGTAYVVLNPINFPVNNIQYWHACSSRF